MQHLRESMSLSERRACRVVGLGRSIAQYRPRRPDVAHLRERMLALAAERPRFGYRRLHVLLRREHFAVNHKRVFRIYRQERLNLRRKGRKRASMAAREKREAVTEPLQSWSMDFTSDSLVDGRAIRTLNIVDDCTRVSPAIEVDTSLPALRVTRVLDRACHEHGVPKQIVIDNGPEFTSRALDAWAYARGIKLHFITPGKPTENAYIESFNGRLRDESLIQHGFTSLSDAPATMESWRQDYNHVRPHSSLCDRTPSEFAAARAGGIPPARAAGALTDQETITQRIS